MPPQVENKIESINNMSDNAMLQKLPRKNTFLYILTFLLFLTGAFGVWYFSNPLPDEDFGEVTTLDKFAGWETYRDTEYGFEFRYPTLGMKVIANQTKPQEIDFVYVNVVENTGSDAFGIKIEKILDSKSTEKGLQNDKNFRLININGGGEIYVFDPRLAMIYPEDGPVANAYIISPDKKYVFDFSLGQDPRNGNVQRYLSKILSTFKFTK